MLLIEVPQLVFLLVAAGYCGSRIANCLAAKRLAALTRELDLLRQRYSECRRPLVVPSPIEPEQFWCGQRATVLSVFGVTAQGNRLSLAVVAEHKPDTITALDRIFGGPLPADCVVQEGTR